MSLGVSRRSLALVTSVLASIAFAATAYAGGSIPVTPVKTPIKVGLEVPAQTAMEPTIDCGAPAIGCLGPRPDTLVIHYPVQTVERFDIVTFNAPNGAGAVCSIRTMPSVLRVIGLAGDTWSERRGYVYINGKKLNEPFINPLFRDHLSYPPRTIPAGEYLLMGDNRAVACDSRRFGPVPFADLVGRVARIERPTFQR
jgi:signal peptidase I